MNSNKEHWILCPACGSKTRARLLPDTVLRSFPLFCPKCRRESIINAQNYKVSTLRICETDQTVLQPDAVLTTKFVVRTASFYYRRYSYEALFREHGNNHYNGHGSCAAGFHRLFGMEPRQHPVLGAQNCIFVCIWIGYLLFCGNAGRAG